MNETKGVSQINSEQQLEYLIQQYQNLIYSVCYKIIGDYFEAQDLAQETFLSAYKNLAHFDGANERAWLCKIATNKCLDYLKHSGRRQIPMEDSYFLTMATGHTTPEATVVEQSLREELFRCCNQLSPPYRDVALDYFYYELDIGEIVEKTGKNIKTLQTQIYRAKGMLKNLYRKEDLRDGA